ncbi:hypothetical protein EIP86_008521 [Pleurotus ostreatoroseus]|nr:hypothetical protein EIP86_008521 [Pleurotus ostreatoroseus]
MYSIATRAALRRAVVAPVSRTTIAVRYSSTVHDNDPETLEKEKHRNLNKEQHKTSTTIHNAPGWNEYLASASEAAVKADRAEITPEQLAAQTVQHVRERHHGNGTEERVDAYEASYERDETTGPLRGGVKEVTKTIKERVSQKAKEISGNA